MKHTKADEMRKRPDRITIAIALATLGTWYLGIAFVFYYLGSALPW